MNMKLVKLQLIVCGFLSLVLLSEWGYSQFAGRQLQDSLHALDPENAAEVELPSIDVSNTAPLNNELVERPLFVEGRKPVVELAPEKVQTVENGQIDDWLLIGIYEKDKRPMALFSKRNEPKKYQKITTQQLISGWVLKEIQPDHVILQEAAELKTVLLRKPRVQQAKPSPAPPPKPGAPAKPGKPPMPPKKINPENENDDSQQN